MTKDNTKKYKMLTAEDVRVIQADPSFSDYVLNSKLKSARKNTVIVALVVMCASLAAGVFVGMSCVKTYMPNNVVQVQVGESAQPVTTETDAESESK